MIKNVLFSTIVFLLMSVSVHAQLLKKIKKAAGRAAEKTIIVKTEEKVSKETGKVMDSVFNDEGGVSKEAETAHKSSEAPGHSENNSKDPQIGYTFNFVPGDKIIFEDDLSKEENGEFPSRWDLLRGNAANAILEGVPIINLDQKAIITPLIKETNYLPEAFTLEFDAYFIEGPSSWQSYNVRFYNGVKGSHKMGDKLLHPLQVFNNGANLKLIESSTSNYIIYKNTKESFSGNLPMWKHISISYNKRSLKVFLDSNSILNIPNIDLSPELVSIEGFTQTEGIRAIKNIRIAQGGKDLYDRIMTEGKFVTSGILFDSGKATLNPNSMGVLKEISQLMKTHPQLKFSIEGHTDNEGEESHNMKLSKNRAQTVRDALTALGIENSRMEINGHGEGMPVADNTTPEGRATNRRVEFIKL